MEKAKIILYLKSGNSITHYTDVADVTSLITAWSEWKRFILTKNIFSVCPQEILSITTYDSTYHSFKINTVLAVMLDELEMVDTLVINKPRLD